MLKYVLDGSFDFVRVCHLVRCWKGDAFVVEFGFVDCGYMTDLSLW